MKQSIREARDIRSDLIALDALVWVAAIRARNGNTENALEWFGLIRNHPKADTESIQNIEKLLPQIMDGLSGEVVHAAEERGKTLDLVNVIAEILSDQ